MNIYKAVWVSVACMAVTTFMSACGSSESPTVNASSTPEVVAGSNASPSTTFELPLPEGGDLLKELSTGEKIPRGGIGETVFYEPFGIGDLQFENVKELYGGKYAVVAAFEENCVLFARNPSPDELDKYDITITKRFGDSAETLVKTNSDDQAEAAEMIAINRVNCH